jgi:2-furoyl-CoA dehydrogenase FAD binding subunit
MKPAAFDYVRAATLEEAHALLAAEGGDVSVMAGGQTLVPLLSTRMARPAVVLDIMHVPELDRITVEDDSIRVGASVRQARLLKWPELAARQPLLALAMPWIGHAQTRARGTVCGSAALADTSAQIPHKQVAQVGEIELSSQGGRRTLAADEFFLGLMSTERADDELIEAVRFPCRKVGEGFAFHEFARRHGDFAIVACAAIAGEGGTRLAVGGVADRACAQDFGSLEGHELIEALDRFAWSLEARDDLHATAAYRRELVRRVGRITIEEARQCRD